MANPQIVQYIRDSIAKGVAHDALAKLLADAGWSPSDIEEGFAAIASSVSETPAQNIPTADFLAEMERRRKAAEAAKPAPQVIPDSPQITMSRSPGTSEKGLIGLVLKTGLVKTKEQANIALTVVLVIVVGLIIWVNFR